MGSGIEFLVAIAWSHDVAPETPTHHSLLK